MWSSWAESAKSSVTQALEKTGDVLSKAATTAGKSASANSNVHGSDAGKNTEVTSSGNIHAYNEPIIVQLPAKLSLDDVESKDTATSNQNQLFTHLSQGWCNVLETTRASIRHAEDAINEQRVMFQQTVIAKAMSSETCKRDPRLPLDVEALQDAEVVYITDRIITMGHPAMDSQVNSNISGTRKLSAVCHLLARRHSGRYMADGRNVAVLHCLTGKGRTSTVLAAFLCWMGEANFSDIYQALEYIAACKRMPVDDLTIPSQRRYASYFKNMLDGVRPSQPPLMLKRIIMSEAPHFAKCPFPPASAKNEQATSVTKNDYTNLLGCVPYIQVFKAGKLLHTAPPSLNVHQSQNELPFCRVSDGNISFNVNLVIQGDILVRARHLTPSKKRVSMFRAAFHTGYAPPNVMRFTKLQLDGACTDDRFIPDFFLDFIFEPIDAEEASKLLQSENDAKDSIADKVQSDTNPRHVSTVQASAEDSMLYGDSRFWDVISNRMKENAFVTSSKTDQLWGPTVGRRRDLSNAYSDLLTPDTINLSEVDQLKGDTVLDAFSIGGELEFLPSVVGSESSQNHPVELAAVNTSVASKPAKDSLMEALMGALDDVDGQERIDDGEVVVEFDNIADASTDAATAFESSSDHDASLVSEPQLVASATHVVNVAAVLTEAQGNLDEDWDALLLAQTNSLTDADLLNLEIDDAELNDLESFLSK